MAYDNVPQRLLDGEAVPRSEIIGYAAPLSQIQVDLILFRFEELFILQRSIVDDRLHFEITAFGQQLRQDLVKRIDGDCPECPE
jgi:hypothetical protein